jgi:sporulation-control protein spo0M
MLLAFLLIYIMHIITDPAVKQDILDSQLKAATKQTITVDDEQNSKKTELTKESNNNCTKKTTTFFTPYGCFLTRI